MPLTSSQISLLPFLLLIACIALGLHSYHREERPAGPPYLVKTQRNIPVKKLSPLPHTTPGKEMVLTRETTHGITTELKVLLPFNQKLNLNQVPEETLVMVRGIGSILAGRIIEYRQSHGPLTSFQELKNIRGMNDALRENFQKIFVLGSFKTEKPGEKEAKSPMP